MKIFDPERWIFTVTASAIALVFVLLTPSTRVMARWYPEKTDLLWVYPGVLFALSFLLWLVYRLSLPRLIRKGFFEDRRKKRPEPPLRTSERIWRWLRPMARLFMQVFLIAAICSSALVFMRSGKNRQLLTKVAESPLYEARVQNHKW